MINETVADSNILGVDPQLQGLALNGGTTRTHGLPEASPAVDKGIGSDPDQRGVDRPVDFPSIPNSMAMSGNGADIGAFELELPPPPVPPGGGATTPPAGTFPTTPAQPRKKCKKRNKGKKGAAAAKKCKRKKK